MDFSFRFFTLAAVSLLTSLAGVASAGSITGAYSYSYAGTVTDGSCTNGSRDNFSGAGSNSIGGADSIFFSACNNTSPNIVGGQFAITDGAGTITGAFSGLLTGNTVIDGNTYGVDQGAYTIATATGAYAGVLDGLFTVESGPVGTALQGTGFLSLQPAPEPTTLAMAGGGILLAILARRRKQTV